MLASASSPPSTPEAGFDRDAYERFRLARRLGQAVASWDDPEIVPGRGAPHMRPDDYVIGLVFRQRPRAYPLWIIDNYHAINDRVDGERILVASCERCQSGSAFRANAGDSSEREPLFRAAGVLNAVLLFKDLRTGSYWNHYEGLALRGRSAGFRLEWIPTYHMEWADWLALHPETEVMAPPQDRTHPDARHGHGREEFFGRPGMDPAFVPTIVGDLDTRYPENQMVLGIHDARGGIAFPLREVQREGGVVSRESSGRNLVVFAGPKPDGFTMAAFLAAVDGQDRSFVREDGSFRDRETESHWSIEGRCTRGSARGATLTPVPCFYVRWHAWVYCHRGTDLFRSDRAFPPLRQEDLSDPELRSVIEMLAADPGDVLTEGPVLSQLRPRESRSSLVLRLGGERIRVHRFTSDSAARDFELLEGGWSAWPYRSTLLANRITRVGRVVLEADPEDRFVDPAQIVPRPESGLPGLLRLDPPRMPRPRGRESPPAEGSPGFIEVLRALRRAGFDVIDAGFLPPSQLRVGCTNGIGVTIEGDRFLLYRFETPEKAADYARAQAHALPAGSFVLRSTPVTMYVDPTYEILYAGDDEVRWSGLLEDARLRRAFGAAGVS